MTTLMGRVGLQPCGNKRTMMCLSDNACETGLSEKWKVVAAASVFLSDCGRMTSRPEIENLTEIVCKLQLHPTARGAGSSFGYHSFYFRTTSS
jgi:hypothetical protein